MLRLDETLHANLTLYKSKQRLIGLLKRVWGGLFNTDPDLTQKLIRRVFSEFPPHSHVLEVACGTGNFPAEVLKVNEHPRFRHFKFFGVDLSPQMVKEARTKMEVVLGSAAQLPLREKSFDYVTMNYLIHHLPTEAANQVVREALRVARRGIIITDVERPANPLGGLFVMLYWKLTDGGYSYRSREEWQALLGTAFEVKEGCAFDRLFVNILE